MSVSNRKCGCFFKVSIVKFPWDNLYSVIYDFLRMFTGKRIIRGFFQDKFMPRREKLSAVIQCYVISNDNTGVQFWWMHCGYLTQYIIF